MAYSASSVPRSQVVWEVFHLVDHGRSDRVGGVVAVEVQQDHKGCDTQRPTAQNPRLENPHRGVGRASIDRADRCRFDRLNSPNIPRLSFGLWWRY